MIRSEYSLPLSSPFSLSSITYMFQAQYLSKLPTAFLCWPRANKKRRLTQKRVSPGGRGGGRARLCLRVPNKPSDPSFFALEFKSSHRMFQFSYLLVHFTSMLAADYSSCKMLPLFFFAFRIPSGLNFLSKNNKMVFFQRIGIQ